MSEIEQIQAEYFRRRDRYFAARKAFNEARRAIRHRFDPIDPLLDLAEQYGYWKGLYSDYKDRYKHLITVNS